MSLIINHQLESITAASGILSLGTNTGALVLPTGGTSSRPSGIAGMIRYNSDGSGGIEIYNGNGWVSFNSGVVGPISSTNNSIPVWNGTSGNTLANSVVLLDSLGNISLVNSISGTSANFNSGTFAGVQVNGNVNATGSGSFNVLSAASLSATNANITTGTITSGVMQSLLITNPTASGNLIGMQFVRNGVSVGQINTGPNNIQIIGGGNGTGNLYLTGGNGVAAVTIGSTGRVWIGTNSADDGSSTLIVNGTISVSQVQAANINSTGGTFTTLVTTTPANTDNSNKVATTAYVQAAGQNSQGSRYISTASPSGGNNGDIWYQV